VTARPYPRAIVETCGDCLRCSPAIDAWYPPGQRPLRGCPRFIDDIERFRGFAQPEGQRSPKPPVAGSSPAPSARNTPEKGKAPGLDLTRPGPGADPVPRAPLGVQGKALLAGELAELAARSDREFYQRAAAALLDDVPELGELQVLYGGARRRGPQTTRAEG
jgi:hypothetical protein